MSDTEKGVKIKIEGDAASLVTASGQGADALKKLKISTEDLSEETKKQLGIGADLNKEMGVIVATQADVESATKKTTDATADSTEKFGQSRREIRLVGNELGRAMGIGGLGGLFLGKIAAAAFFAAKALGFLKNTWADVMAAIKGPINIDVKVDEAAPGKISAVAAAWETYAAAYKKVADAYNSPQAEAGREEKKLANELKLIKEVLAAEREKEMIEAGDNKAAQDAVKAKFDHAGEQVDSEGRQRQIKIKQDEAQRLRDEAAKKYKEAGAIHTGEGVHSAGLEKTAEENAAEAEKAKKEIQANLDLIARQKKSGTGNIHGTDEVGGDVPEYEGFGGAVTSVQETWAFKKKYGYTASIADAEAIEKQRLAQATGVINSNEVNKAKVARDQEKKKKLLDEAGTEMGQAGELDKDIKIDQATAAADDATAAQVSGIKSGADTEKRIGEDVKTINEFDSSKNPSKELLAKAAAAMKDLSDSLAAHHEFLGYFNTLGLTARQLKADQVKLARDMAALQSQMAASARHTW